MSKNKNVSLKTSVNNFFEHPKGFFAVGFQVMIFLMIIASVAIAFMEFFEHADVLKYKNQLNIGNHVILVVFTLEYALRLWSAPKRIAFIVKPMSIIDFLAVFPNYLELVLPIFIDTTELRVLRLIRLLRFARALRVLRLFKFGALFKKVFQFQETILEAIFPIMVLFIMLKGIFWFLEAHGLWISNQDLGNLFAIIGFALGIILSQKIGVSYDKFVQVEEAAVRLYGGLWTLSNLEPKVKLECKKWAQQFLDLLENSKADNYLINIANAQFLKELTKKITGFKNSESLVGLYEEACKDAAFCLSKKTRLTPKAYDTLLHQATMLYLALIAAFIPGVTGLISVFVGTYILYGMYNLTQDLDSIIGGEFNLINIDISELKYLVKGESILRASDNESRSSRQARTI